MQTINAYSYPNEVRALFATSPLLKTGERVMYTNNLLFYQGLGNPVKIRFRNQDQKPVNITNLTIVATLTDTLSHHVILEKNATIEDATNGIALVVFSGAESALWNTKNIDLGIRVVDSVGNTLPVYIDDNFGLRLPCRVQSAPIGRPTDPIQLSLTSTPLIGLTSQSVVLADLVPGNTLFSVTGNMSNFNGTIKLQATMMTSPGTNDWADVASSTWTNQSGTFLLNGEGTFALARVLIPIGYTGTVSNLLLRF